MKRLLLLVLVLFAIDQLHATHLAGGVIEVECIGGNQFRVILRKYRDQSGITLQPNYPIIVRNASTGATNNYTATQISYTQSLQPPITNPCLVPPANSGTDEGVYQATVTMANGSSYQIYNQDNDRNTTMNVVGQVGQSIYAEFSDPGVYGCNNSPKFTVGPPVSVCINEPLNYNNSATDLDGDSLAYRFCAALTTAPAAPPFNSVPYSGGYSATYPVSSNPALAINPTTGFVSGTPNLSGRWVFTVCVDEFRNGVKIGEYRRDVQMTVTACNTQNQANVNTSYTSLALGIPVIASCDDFSVTFQNSSTGATSYWWDFGVPGITNDTSNAQNPTYVYPDTGTFTATLIINKGFICADTVYRTVIVYPVINAGFASTPPRCVNQNIPFTDTSNLTYGTVDFWIWNFPFATPSTSGAPTPAPRWTAAGTFNVRLVIESSKGCRDTIFQPVTISPNPTINLANSFNVCEEQSFLIPAQSNGVSFQWTPPTGLNCDTCLNPTVTPAATTVYQLTATNAAGCSVTRNTTVVVRPSPNISAGPDQFLCGTGSVQLNAVHTGAPQAMTWSWTPPTGLSATNIPNPTASPTVATTYIVTATNPSTGCVDRDTITVFLNSVSVDAGANQTICPGSNAQLNATSPVAGTWSWAPATGLSSTSVANPVASPSATTTYTVTITDPVSGCSGTDTVRISVNPLPPVNAGNDTTICVGTAAQLQASGATSYVWDTDPALSSVTIANPVATPSVTRWFYVTGSDAIGCTGRDSVRVTVVSPATVIISNDTTICSGSSAQLTASGGVSYVWTPAATLTGAATATPVATPANTTTYTVAIVDANGCSNTADVTVTVAPPPNIDAGSAGPICFGDSVQLTATGGVTYTWTPNTNIINANTANPTVFPPANRWYTVLGTDANGCRNRDSVLVVVNTVANGSFSPDTAICAGESVQLSASGFTSYAWKPAASLSCANCPNPVATPATTTRYTVVVSDANGCTDSTNILVTVNPLPVLNASSPQTICVGDSVQIAVNLLNGQSYSWSPAGSLSNATIRTPFAKPVVTTVYTVTATNTNGCSNTATVTVNVNPLPTVTTGFATTTICDGDSVQLSASGAVSYQWSPGATLSCTACPDPIAFPQLNTIYTVRGTDANGCRNTATTEVRVNVLQPGNFIADTAICIGESVTLFANGFNSYLWFPGTDLTCTACPNPVATPAATITYFAAVEDANGCKDTGSVTITVNPLPTPSITVGDDSICIGSQTTLTATGGVQYVWTPAAGLSAANIPNPIATPQNTTSYTVEVTDGNGCKNTTTQSITVLPLPVVTVASASPYVCKYDSTQLTATGGVSYQWLPGGSLTCTSCPDPQAFPLVTTQYTVQVTDQYGCVNNDSIEISVNAAAGNISPDTAICINGAARLRINGGVSYSWWPATDLSCTNCPTPLSTPSSTITYSVQVTDANGCRDTAGVTVTVNPLPVVSAGPDATICSGDNTQLNGVAPTATVFTWTPAAGLSNAAIATPTASPAITTTYVLAVEDANTCKNRDTVVVTVNQRPNTNAGNDVSICVGDTVQMNAGGAVSYTWTPAGGLSCNNCPNPLAYPSSTTTYTVRGVAANGCTRDDQVTVTVNTLPVITVTPATTICIGDNVQLTASGAISYQWSPATGLNNPAIANPIATPSQTTTYTVVGTNAAGCIDEATVTVTVASPASVTITADTSVCPGESVQLSASGGVTYNWSPSLDIVGAQTANPIVTPSQTRTYTVDIVDANGCDIRDDVTITIYVPADPIAGKDTTICFGETIPLTAANGVTYTWSPAGDVADASAAMTTASPAQTTVYTVSIVDANGCPNSDEVTITVIQLPNVDAGPDISIYDGSPVVLQATGAASYVWWPSLWVSDTTSDRTFAYPEDTITYYVLGTDAFGCQQIDSVTIFVLPTPKFFVANAFSPNGDGENDVFTVQFPENFNLLSMKIFNRWGELVYQTDNIGQPWTGLTANGQPAPMGTYVYWLEGADDIGNPLLRQGNLTLLR